MYRNIVSLSFLFSKSYNINNLNCIRWTGLVLKSSVSTILIRIPVCPLYLNRSASSELRVNAFGWLFMFVRVLRVDTGLHFTVVDILCAETGNNDNKDAEQELHLILDLGVIQAVHLNSQQAWYIIAENLIASELAESEKQLLAKDIANWLPPLSRQSLLKAKAEDLRQLSALYPDNSAQTPAIPVELAETDPLTIIADWLDAN